MRGRRALQDMGGQSRGDVCASMAVLRGLECGNVAEPRARDAALRVEFRGIADVVHSSDSGDLALLELERRILATDE